MKNELKIIKGGGALRTPESAKIEIAKAQAMIDVAAKMQDWQLLGTAIDHMIEWQTFAVEWWTENVSVGHGGDRRGKNKNAGLRSCSAADAEKEIGISQQQISRWRSRLSDFAQYRQTLWDRAHRDAMAQRGVTDQRGASGTGENEWYTPQKYIDLARKVLGGIDLDPASSDHAQQRIKADKHFSKETDGLSKEWNGRVWLNPPYAQPLIAQFVQKMCDEVKRGGVEAAIMLTHNYTDTTWFHAAARTAQAICFSKGRVRFEKPDGTVAAPTQGQAFFYFGEEIPVFRQHFNDVGFVALVGR